MSHHGVLLTIGLYFLLACVALALLFLPGARALAWQWWQSALGRARTAQQGANRQSQAAARWVGMGGSTAQKAWRWLYWRWPFVAASVALLAGVPLLVVALKNFVSVDAFDHTLSRQVDTRVAALLAGEQLVPPPALPPELFVTREVELARPQVRFASRAWELLDEQFRQRLLWVFKTMRDHHGIELVLLEGYRSPQRQAQLAAMGGQVTMAGAFESYHQYGMAADVAFMRNGKIVITEQDPWAMRAYELYGEVSQSFGLTWGGSWRSIKDFGHVELRRPGVLRRRSQQDESPTLHVH